MRSGSEVGIREGMQVQSRSVAETVCGRKGRGVKGSAGNSTSDGESEGGNAGGWATH